jgi:hypothetical protein
MWHLVSAARSCLGDANACRWLLAHGCAEEGEAALKKLVPGPEREGMLTELREQAEKQRKHARVPLRAALGTPELRRQLHIGDSPFVFSLHAGKRFPRPGASDTIWYIQYIHGMACMIYMLHKLPVFHPISLTKGLSRMVWLYQSWSGDGYV